MKAIIGTGITACTHATLYPDAILYDKARFPGGRMSSKPFIGKFFADIGATYIKESIEIQKNNKISSRSIASFLQSKGIETKTYRMQDQKTMIYSGSGMQSIVEKLLLDSKVHFDKELKKIYQSENRDKGKFLLQFIDGTEEYYDEVVITAPLPQALLLIENTPFYNIWEKFTAAYNKYRKTLVACGFWKNSIPEISQELKALGNHSFLRKGEDAEYISIESSKLSNVDQESKSEVGSGFESGMVIMIQFSEKFSDTHFGKWKETSGEPSKLCENFFNFHSNKLFTNLKEPDRIRSHQWKYAQAENSMLGKSGILNLDLPEFAEYKSIVASTGITLTGDWVYGPRIERIIAGELERN